MKKIFLSLLLVGGTLLSSCNMDELAPGQLNDEEALQTVTDAQQFRNNVYSSIRALCSGTYVTDTELEMDHFIGVQGNGSRGQTFSTAQITSSTSDVGDNYAGCYSVMKNINFLISGAEEIKAKGNLSETEMISLDRYIGEAHFFRAYIYYWLLDHYCQAYDPAKGDTPGMGLQIVTKYEPTGDPSKWPGRSTQNETYALINSDLATAYSYLKEYETTDKSNCTPNASYISSYAVAALQARVALLQQDYTTAINKANEVIDSKIYPLATGTAYTQMWTTDSGTELIFVPFVDASESAYVGSFMNAWAYYANYPTRVDYVPSAATLAMYDSKDVRNSTFFRLQRNMNVDGNQVNAYIFLKFPGNSSLIQGTNEYKNKPKPFRTSELYLILAEAAAATGDNATANSALNTLRAARITGWDTTTSFSGQALVDEIRVERDKELIGEGFRMSDLRRWNLGFTRDGSAQPLSKINEFYIYSNVNVAFAPGDYRYVWPIPSDEMQATPALKGQQNPGY